MPNNISKLFVFGDHAVCITNTSIHIFGELVDCLSFCLSIPKLSLKIDIRKCHSGQRLFGIVHSTIHSKKLTYTEKFYDHVIQYSNSQGSSTRIQTANQQQIGQPKLGGKKCA
jgi:hypothetical protein